jgi:hypothetical protein
MSDQSAAEYYANPENRRVTGPPRRRDAKRHLSNHVSIRFAPAIMAWVRLLAARDGVTAGSWIRSVVEREVERRLPFVRTGVTTYELHSSLVEQAATGTVNQTGEVPSTFELVAS